MKWISVDERLPELNITVIGYEETCGTFPAELDEREWFDLESQVFIPPHQHVSYWMPLPEPPKSDEKLKNSCDCQSGCSSSSCQNR